MDAPSLPIVCTASVDMYCRVGAVLVLVSIPIPLSRGSLARLVGAREETVIRAMSVWRQEGWVSTDASGFTLHEIEPLKALLGDGDSPLSEG